MALRQRFECTEIAMAFLMVTCVYSVIQVPGMQSGCEYVYHKEGDIKLGYLPPMHTRNNPKQWCGTSSYSFSLKYVEAFRFVIEQMNQNTSILPNITLGWVMLDSCNYPDAHFARALQFFPDSEDNTNEGTDDKKVCNDDGTPSTYDVAAVVGPSNSESAIFTAYTLGLAHIPMISPLATTDELSDQARFPYMARMVPPDKFQAEAMVDIAVYFNWTYVSVIYSEGPYGENGGKNIEKQIKKKGLCREVSYMISSEMEDEPSSFDELVLLLARRKKARVVFVFVKMEVFKPFFEALERHGLLNHFIFLFSDSAILTKYKAMNGGFIINHIYQEDKTFKDYYLKLTPFNNEENPWMRLFWKALFKCTWTNESADNNCHQYENTTKFQFVGPYVSKTIDSAMTLILGLHDLLSTKCPEVFMNKALLKTCVNGDDYMNSIKNVTFEGTAGTVKFDQQGDMLGAYRIEQIIYNTSSASYEYVDAGYWDKETDVIKMNDNDLIWTEFGDTLPESVCSKPCGLKKYYVRSEIPCCWECKSCRENEIVVNQETCRQCNLTEWPDTETATKCVPIPPTYLKWNILAIILATFAILGVLSSLLVAGLFRVNKDAKLIRASSKELKAIILVGILFAYVSVFFYLAKPSNWSCICRYVGFNVSVSLIYAPLLTKTNRVFRIFSAGKRGVVRPSYISTKAQLVLTFLLLTLQMTFTGVTMAMAPPLPTVQQPIPTQQLAELYCEMSVEAFMIPIALNIVLILLCAVHGFLTRSLPENFNESKFIFVSVCTTTFLWMVFLPTYFTTFYTYHQAAILAFCLILNATITLLCLFVPKIYAIYFIDESDIKFSSTITGSITVVSAAIKTSQVMPLDEQNQG